MSDEDSDLGGLIQKKSDSWFNAGSGSVLYLGIMLVVLLVVVVIIEYQFNRQQSQMDHIRLTVIRQFDKEHGKH